MRRGLVAIAAAVSLLACARAAWAEADVPAPPHLFRAPTAWIRPNGTFQTSAGIDHLGGSYGSLAAGLGHLAELEVTITDISGSMLPYVSFKMGLSVGRTRLALGYRKSFSPFASIPRTADVHAVAGLSLGSVRLHAGVSHLTIESTASDLVALRPFFGVEWTPSIYPRSTLLADFLWSPLLSETSASLPWLADLGVRYRVFSWSSIELGVQIRQHDLLDHPSIFLRATLH